MSSQSPALRFRQTTTEFLTFTHNIILELNEGGYSSVGPDGLVLPLKVINELPPEPLIEAFINCHDDWEKVFKENIDFILTTVPQTYRGIPFDVNLLTVPLKIYVQYVEHEIPDEERIVTSDDIKSTWDFFRSMIRIACNHIHLKRQPYYHDGESFTYQDPGYHADIDLDHYVKLFAVKLNRI